MSKQHTGYFFIIFSLFLYSQTKVINLHPRWSSESLGLQNIFVQRHSAKTAIHSTDFTTNYFKPINFMLGLFEKALSYENKTD